MVHQLESKSKYLYMYLDALFEKDAQIVLPYSDRMVRTTHSLLAWVTPFDNLGRAVRCVRLPSINAIPPFEQFL